MPRYEHIYYLKSKRSFDNFSIKRKLNINNLNKIIYKSVYTKQLFTQYQHSVKRLLSRYAWYQERAKLTDKLRYQVLKRDHYRCVICGRGAKDGVKLHVDHIKPVARGGKTILSNLRTLCADCNLGKSSSYDANYKYAK